MCIENRSFRNARVTVLIESTPQPKNDSSAEAAPLPIIVMTSIENPKPSFNETGEIQLTILGVHIFSALTIFL